ncbi:hypothetical protein DFH06DRAFT_1481073 [Mycena polygramma]|nr:hypothetical protein DFH06DRAFT_1481073 [Mycena polygramma]
MLLALSTELLGEIGGTLDQGDCASLRATCKRLSDSVEHLFFSCFVLSTDRLLSRTGVEFLVALTSARSGWSRHAKTLHIKLANRARASQGFVASKLQMWTFIAALEALQNIASVRWETSGDDPEWERTAVCEYMDGLPKLEELQLVIRGGVDLSLPVLSRIKKLKVKELGGPLRVMVPGEPPLVREICQRVTPSLTALELDFPPPWSNSNWSNVWSGLQARAQDKIHLTELSTSVVTPSLFAYLVSYSGLQTLRLTPDAGAISDRLADMFYETALAHHASLATLSCPAAYEGRWSFGPHNAQYISTLRNLTALEMSINAGRAQTIEPPEDSYWYQWLKNSGYMGASILGHRDLRVEVEQSDIDPVVADLLHAAASLPALRSLVILAAESEEYRGTAYGQKRGNHRKGVTNAIHRAVRKLSPDIPCGVVVHVGNHTYQRRATAMDDMEEEVHPPRVALYPVATLASAAGSVPVPVILHHD